MMRNKILVAAIGHAWLKDQGFGIRLVEELERRGLPEHVVAADWSFGTIAAFQKLEDVQWHRVIVVSGTKRGRTPGSLHRFVPAADLPPDAEVHARIGDCIMGCVCVDNFVILGRYYRALPDDLVCIEVEPVDETWGNDLSPHVAPLLDRAAQWTMAEIRRGSHRGYEAHADA